VRLVQETSGYLRAGWSPERIARQLGRSVMVSAHLREPLGLNIVLRSGDVAHGPPNEAAIGEAAMTIRKHLELRSDDDERRRVQIVVAHALVAFGGKRVTLSWARNAVGLKKKRQTNR
jgi:hypothetical protein